MKNRYTVFLNIYDRSEAIHVTKKGGSIRHHFYKTVLAGRI